MRIEQIGNATLINADCRVAMAAMDENSIDSIVCDPPYGLSQARPTGRSAATEGAMMKGFMGMAWDHGVLGIEFWQAALRVAKPGAHLLAFGGTRTFHRLMVAIEDAGWEIRDTFMWVYGSGMPKSKNLHDDAPGYGSALKPAWEPIVMARKPLIGTLTENWRQFGTGALNIDGCRVPLISSADAAEFANNHAVTERLPAHYDGQSLGLHDGGWKQRVGPATVPPGRWPANLLHDGSNEILAAFPDAPGQMAKAAEGGDRRKDQNVFGAMTRGSNGAEPREDSGSAARFFYCAKASKADRDEGLELAPDQVLARSCQAAAEAKRGNTVEAEAGAFNKARVRKNHHPTVKPTALMRYLCRLVTPPGGLVLDPFMGSASTGKAALLEGFGFVGIDNDIDHGYFDIACARIRHATLSK